MLVTFVAWIFITWFCFTAGKFFFLFSSKLLRLRKIESDFFQAIVGGLMVTLFVLQLSHLFSPINIWIFLILTALTFIFAISKQLQPLSELKNALPIHIRPKIVTVAVIIASLALLLSTAKQPLHYDTDLYHAPTIRWLENYPIVPGLANLHYRFGYNSNWHLLSAFFGFNFFDFQTLHVLNGWLVWIFGLFAFSLIIKESNTKADQKSWSAFGLIVFILVCPHFTEHLSSPTTDFPIIALTWLLTIWFVNEKKDSQSELPAHNLLLFFVPLVLITIKLSALPLLVFSLIGTRRIWTKYGHRAFIFMLIGAVIVSVYLLRNIIISGYPLYPLEKIAPIKTDWLVPNEIVKSDREWIWSWAFVPSQSLELVKENSWPTNFILWQTKTLSKFDLGFFYLGTASLLSLAFSQLRKMKKKTNVNENILIATLAFAWVFWLASAPDPRFAYGFLAISIALFMAKFDRLQLKKIWLIKFLVIFTIVVTHFQIKWHESNFGKISEFLVIPGKFKTIENQTITKNGLRFFISKPNTDLTGYYDFPSAPYWEENLVLRGEKLENGFKKMPQTPDAVSF